MHRIPARGEIGRAGMIGRAGCRPSVHNRYVSYCVV